ncbi:hypothetical protein CHS0354_027182 [Potamilus streckersoni]|uniref:Uncharacterized protein n=1 Tax=Potamilus streckersoni TaxID=2493646 RepID=A0AAE0T2A5_9BIVA|nr:hypothetical protein CHS0354_027182 [Potamilus streckersoni]
MEKERKGKRESYVPVENFGERAHKTKKNEVNERVNRHYLKKKISQMTPVNNIEDGLCSSTKSHEKTTILVKFPSFGHNNGKGLRNRYKSSLKNAQRKIQVLEHKNVDLSKCNKRIQQRVERLGSKSTKAHDSSDADLDTTLETDENSVPSSQGIASCLSYIEDWHTQKTGGQKNHAYIHLMDSQRSEFRNHVKRVKVHYQEMRNLRENVPENEVILHTMVVYCPKSQGQRLQSFVGVSDVLCHNATVVYTILKKLITMLQSTYPSIKTIHYLTDSPTSQYRNKTIFKILADHSEDFGIAAADMAILQEKCLIQNAEDFYTWSKQTEESGSKIKYLYYNQADVDMRNEIIQQKEKPMQISGTFKRQDEEVFDTNGTLMPTLEVAAKRLDKAYLIDKSAMEKAERAFKMIK